MLSYEKALNVKYEIYFKYDQKIKCMYVLNLYRYPKMVQKYNTKKTKKSIFYIIKFIFNKVDK